MPGGLSFLVLAIGGVLFLEGACYALFPNYMKQAMAEMFKMSESTLRMTGLILAVIGFLIVYMLMPKS